MKVWLFLQRMDKGGTGGIFGWSYAQGVTVQECYNIGTITGIGGVGGIAGSIDSWHGGTMNITNSYNTGTIIRDTGACAGIVGGTGTNAEGIVSFTNCYNAGKMEYLNSVTNTAAYSICNYGTMTNVYYLENCGETVTTGTTAVTKEELKSEAFVKMLGEDVWKMSSKGYPVLQWEN